VTASRNGSTSRRAVATLHPLGSDLPDHLVRGRVGRAPELRAAVARPPALGPVAGGGDARGRVVGGVAPPVRVVLGGPDAPQPHVGVREEVVRAHHLARVVHVQDVVLDPLRQVVGRLVDGVRRLKRLLRRFLFEDRIEVREQPERLVAVAGDHVLDRDRIAPLRGGLQVVDRATEVATVSLRDPFERVRLELDPLLATDVAEDGDDGARGDIAELDLLCGVPEPARHVVVVVGDRDDGLTPTP